MLQRKVMPVDADETQESTNSNSLDPRVLSSVLISVKMAQMDEKANGIRTEDPHARLLELMHSAPVRAILDAAVLLSERQGIAPHEALQQIVLNLQEIDSLWNQVLMKEGLARLSSQYH